MLDKHVALIQVYDAFQDKLADNQLPLQIASLCPVVGNLNDDLALFQPHTISAVQPPYFVNHTLLSQHHRLPPADH